jgi:small subunit ribosomal protein S20
MANHASAAKRHRQSIRRRDRNREAKAALRLAVKKARTAAETGDVKNAKLLLVEAERALARAASKGTVHRKNAARRIGRLAAAVAKAGSKKK